MAADRVGRRSGREEATPICIVISWCMLALATNIASQCNIDICFEALVIRVDNMTAHAQSCHYIGSFNACGTISVNDFQLCISVFNAHLYA